VYDKYEAVIGLEIHAQMLTQSKAYSSDANEYGAMPNTRVNPVSLGHPGTLPVFNKKVMEYAMRLGIACHSNIRSDMHFARKNYFYPDLPKGYQITQDNTPICSGGFIEIKNDDGQLKKINITRIHMEEDAGKSMHDVDPFYTLVDLNRAGVPLLEIVSEPDLRSGKEAYNYVTEIRRLVRYLEICDGNMEEGSLRCDANISVRLKGSAEFGTKVEVKNMNSMRNVQRAIEYEIIRQVDLIEKGEKFQMETRTFDAVNGITLSMRSKEGAHDYRYFPEPDLQPVHISQEYLTQIKNTLPPLPQEMEKKYKSELGLSEYDASVLTENKEFALYFEKLITYTKNYKSAANWMMTTVKQYLNEQGIEIGRFPLRPAKIAEIISIIDEGKVSHTAAAQQIFPEIIKLPNAKPLELAQQLNLIQESNESVLRELVKQAIAKYPDKVVQYKSGQKGLVGLFMGEVMKLSGGKADPKSANKMVIQMLDETV
jgi:aspartyl-tRNA(Asn)/glutamyl-tRNA(Gln) amidotransferase subunit B